MPNVIDDINYRSNEDCLALGVEGAITNLPDIL